MAPSIEAELRNVLFTVDEREVFVLDPTRPQSMFGECPPYVKVPGYKAIVDRERNQALGIVSQAYRLVTNEEALAIGKEAFSQYFEKVSREDFRVYKVYTPATRSYCHIDLINPHYRSDRIQQDTWLPYLRVTNSYNASRALRLELGFVRSACSNGVILAKETIEIRLSHTRKEIDRRAVVVHAGVERLKRLEAEFLSYLENLKGSRVPRLYALPMMALVLNAHFEVDHEDEARRARERKRFKEFKEAALPLVDRYYSELGSTAYAVLNAATDYASHPRSATQVQSVGRLQVAAGEWLRDYAARSKQPDFDLDQYTGKYLHLFS